MPIIFPFCPRSLAHSFARSLARSINVNFQLLHFVSGSLKFNKETHFLLFFARKHTQTHTCSVFIRFHTVSFLCAWVNIWFSHNLLHTKWKKTNISFGILIMLRFLFSGMGKGILYRYNAHFILCYFPYGFYIWIHTSIRLSYTRHSRNVCPAI